MGRLKITDVNMENAKGLISLCIPPDKKDDPLFIKGMNAKKKWATRALEMYGGIAKLAYLKSRPVGLIQYQPDTEKRVDKILTPSFKYLESSTCKINAHVHKPTVSL